MDAPGEGGGKQRLVGWRDASTAGVAPGAASHACPVEAEPHRSTQRYPHAKRDAVTRSSRLSLAASLGSGCVILHCDCKHVVMRPGFSELRHRRTRAGVDKTGILRGGRHDNGHGHRQWHQPRRTTESQMQTNQPMPHFPPGMIPLPLVVQRQATCKLVRRPATPTPQIYTLCSSAKHHRTHVVQVVESLWIVIDGSINCGDWRPGASRRPLLSAAAPSPAFVTFPNRAYASVLATLVLSRWLPGIHLFFFYRVTRPLAQHTYSIRQFTVSVREALVGLMPAAQSNKPGPDTARLRDGH